MQDGPGGWVWGEAADEVTDAGCRLVPVYAAGLLEDLGSRTEFTDRDIRLRYGLDIAGQDILQGTDGKVCSQYHQFVMHGLSIVIGQNRNTLLVDYIAGVNLML